MGQNSELYSWDCEQGTLLSFYTLLWGRADLTEPKKWWTTQLPPGEIRNIFVQVGESGSKLKSEET
jgi:hypothetical protein